jgi:hypothetical protein
MGASNRRLRWLTYDEQNTLLPLTLESHSWVAKYLDAEMCAPGNAGPGNTQAGPGTKNDPRNKNFGPGNALPGPRNM